MNKREMKNKMKEMEITIKVLEGLKEESAAIFSDQETSEFTKEYHGNRWNSIHDLIEEIKNDMSYLEIHWDDDKLTQSELYEMELMHNNID